MNNAVFCLLRRKGLGIARWAICLFPICFTGCFESQSATNRSNGKSGISSLSRFFSFTRSAPSEEGSEPAPAAEFPAFPQATFSGIPYQFQDLQDPEIALPVPIGAGRMALEGTFDKGSPRATGSGPAAPARVSSIGESSALLLNKSFSQFFSSAFRQSGYEDISRVDADEFPNPFTEARQKQDSSSASSETKTDDADKSDSQPESSAEASNQPPADPVGLGSGTGAPVERFLIIGDFAGTGTLSTLEARRAGEMTFVSDDGERSFKLYVNPDAVGRQRAFYVDDMNGDGHADLLVTSGAALFGSVLLGDGAGGYQPVDKFVTGYEPTIPSAGPARNGMREILTVNVRSGALSTFTSDDSYRAVQVEKLSFVPNYLLHLVAPDTSRDYVMAAQVRGMEQIFGWGDDNLLQPAPDVLGEDATVLSGSFESGYLQAFQVGRYASVVLENRGESFNVANLRVMPGTFLLLGDFSRRGTLDVAVGSLSYFTPKKN